MDGDSEAGGGRAPRPPGQPLESQKFPLACLAVISGASRATPSTPSVQACCWLVVIDNPYGQHSTVQVRKDAASGRHRCIAFRRQVKLEHDLYTLIRFETYDGLARAGHNREEMIAVIDGLARAAIVGACSLAKPHKPRAEAV